MLCGYRVVAVVGVSVMWSAVALAQTPSSSQQQVLRESGDRSGDREASSFANSGGAQEQRPYLGIALEQVPEAFASQLPDLIKKEQGLLVTEVEKESPADQAGLQQHDILVSYDDQRLCCVEQLGRLLFSDEPGREVKLGVVREAQLMTRMITLGEETIPEQPKFEEEFEDPQMYDPQGYESQTSTSPRNENSEDEMGGSLLSVETGEGLGGVVLANQRDGNRRSGNWNSNWRRNNWRGYNYPYYYNYNYNYGYPRYRSNYPYWGGYPNYNRGTTLPWYWYSPFF